MFRTYIAILLLSIFIVVFALQNAEPVHLYLFTWDFESSLSLIIIFSIAIGTILSFLVSFIELRKMNKTLKEKNDTIKEKDIQINALEKKVARENSYSFKNITEDD